MTHATGWIQYRTACGLVALVGLIVSPVNAQDVGTNAPQVPAAIVVESLTEKALQEHVNVLASDSLEGREAGSRGGRAAATYLTEQLKQIGMQPAGPNGDWFQPFGDTIEYRNILALIPGTDPVLRNEHIVIGAHYDHVGYGNATNSYGPFGQIHNGADDNASGCSTLLEMMRAIKTSGFQPKRSLLFAFWDGEEKNLLGSKHYVSAPTIPLTQIKMVVNVDMVGRLTDERMEMLGTRTGAGLRRLVSERNLEEINIDFNWDIVGDSDHYPFVQRQIPYLMPFTDKHGDYHRPSDDPDRVNAAGMRRVGRMVLRVLLELANTERTPVYRSRCRVESEGTRRGFERPLPTAKPRLGVQTNRTVSGGLVVRGLVPNTPAGLAGFQVGDEILSFDGRDVTAENFPEIVQTAPETTNAAIRRNGTVSTLNVQLEGAPRRLGIAWRTDACEPGTMMLSRVVAGSPAFVSGLRVGDRIYSVNGRTTVSDDQFLNLIKTSEQLQVTVERKGRLFVANVKLPPLATTP
ncbi:MAG: M20/M25/M40 family metallo-hydrolase [Planctomycetaceae bacterium]